VLGSAAGAVAASSAVKFAMASSAVAPHISSIGRKRLHTSGRSG
jgi:hypothetical protein